MGLPNHQLQLLWLLLPAPVIHKTLPLLVQCQEKPFHLHQRQQHLVADQADNLTSLQSLVILTSLRVLTPVSWLLSLRTCGRR